MSIEFVRIVFIIAVISVHIMATGPLYNSPTSGAVWMLFHVSRNLFIILTSIVLIYSFGVGRPFNAKKFYLKRFALVLIPYMTWSLIYQVGHGIQQHTVFSFLSTFVYNIVTANAMYHLYFLLLSMQIYLLFPLIRYLFGKIKQYPRRVIAISFIIQLVITSFIHYSPNIPGLSWWFNYPDKNILSYQFYIVIGAFMASNVKAFEDYIYSKRRVLYKLASVVAVFGQVIYLLQAINGVSPAVASAVFQPYLVIESTVFGLALFALGVQWNRGGMSHKRLVTLIAEDSFGIYLCHVFVISYVIVPFQPASNNWITALTTLIVGVPVVYALSFGLTELARHTPLSLLLTGRKSVGLNFGLSKKEALV
ncbi:MAG TPA: acyltransferase [Candidatus Saccharimonadales bacterium]|nr:acyltransferase [Candidatus Saccharimonadales bacterium]